LLEDSRSFGNVFRAYPVYKWQQRKRRQQRKSSYIFITRKGSLYDPFFIYLAQSKDLNVFCMESKFLFILYAGFLTTDIIIIETYNLHISTFSVLMDNKTILLKQKKKNFLNRRSCFNLEN